MKNTIDFIITHNTKSLAIILGAILLWSCQSEDKPATYADDGEAQYFEDYEPPRYKWGLIDIRGNNVIEPIYDDLKDPLDLQHIPASLAGKWSYISLQGEPIVPFQFKSVQQWQGGVGWAQNWQNTYHIVTNAGIISDTIKASQVKPFSHDLAPVKLGSTWKYVDKKGNIAIDQGYLSAKTFNEHKQAIVKTIKGYGTITLKGDQVITPQYLSLKSEDLGYIAKTSDGYLYLDTQGKRRIDKTYDKATRYYKGTALVKSNDTYSLINTRGKIIHSLPYSLVSEGGEGYWKYREDGLWGILDTKGEVLCPAIYSDSYRYQEGFLTASIGDNWGIIDSNCEELLPFTFPILWSFREGYTRFIANGFIQVIDSTGRVLPHINQVEIKEFVNGVARYQHYPLYDDR